MPFNVETYVGYKNDFQKLEVAQQFAFDCQTAMVGIGPLKGQMMVQLCSLFGPVPLDFYTFLPIHLKGGPGIFMKEMMNWEKTKDNSLLQWNVDIVSRLQQLYNKEVTYNLFENGSCEIGRRNPPNDLYFLIPNATKDKQGMIQFKFNSSCLQFFFRVDGNRQMIGEFRCSLEVPIKLFCFLIRKIRKKMYLNGQ